jgi:hypothetical protein
MFNVNFLFMSTRMTKDEFEKLIIDDVKRHELIKQLRKGEIELVDNCEPSSAIYTPVSASSGISSSNEPYRVVGPNLPTLFLYLLDPSLRAAVVEYWRTLAEEKASDLIAAGNMRQARQASELLRRVTTDPTLAPLLYEQLGLSSEEFKSLTPQERMNRLAYALAAITQFNSQVQEYEDHLEQLVKMTLQYQKGIDSARSLNKYLPQIIEATRQMKASEPALREFIEASRTQYQLQAEAKKVQISAAVGPRIAYLEGLISTVTAGTASAAATTFLRTVDYVGEVISQHPIEAFSSFGGIAIYLVLMLYASPIYDRIKLVSPNDLLNVAVFGIATGLIVTGVYKLLKKKLYS